MRKTQHLVEGFSEIDTGASEMAGKIGEALGLPSATLAFHLKELKHAGLITFRRDGRSLIYAAIYPAMNDLLAYLTENCCQGNSAACDVAVPPTTSRPKAMA